MTAVLHALLATVLAAVCLAVDEVALLQTTPQAGDGLVFSDDGASIDDRGPAEVASSFWESAKDMLTGSEPAVQSTTPALLLGKSATDLAEDDFLAPDGTDVADGTESLVTEAVDLAFKTMPEDTSDLSGIEFAAPVRAAGLAAAIAMERAGGDDLEIAEAAVRGADAAEVRLSTMQSSKADVEQKVAEELREKAVRQLSQDEEQAEEEETAEEHSLQQGTHEEHQAANLTKRIATKLADLSIKEAIKDSIKTHKQKLNGTKRYIGRMNRTDLVDHGHETTNRSTELTKELDDVTARIKERIAQESAHNIATTLISGDSEEHCTELTNRGAYSTMPLSVGTPPQTFDVVADTGSDSVIIASCYCVKKNLGCAKAEKCFVGTHKSSSFYIPGPDDAEVPLIEITFGSGAIVATLATDIVDVDGLTTTMKEGVVLMLNRTALDIDTHFEGILGLGPPMKTAAPAYEIMTPFVLTRSSGEKIYNVFQ